MALVTRAELARMVGWNYYDANRSRIYKAVKAGNLIEDENQLIETTNETNSKWMLKMARKWPNMSGSNKATPPSLDGLASEKLKLAENMISETDTRQLELLTKQQDLKKKEAETKLLELREKKMRGELIPADIAINVMTQFSHMVLNEMKNGIEDIVTVYSKEFKFTLDQIATLRKQQVDILNISINKATELALSTIESLMDVEDDDDEDNY